MKKIVVCTAALVCLTAMPGSRSGNAAMAQTTAADAQTMVTVTLVVEREVVLRGPYARYASQYLGITGAALNDRESFRIVDGAIGYYRDSDGFSAAQRLLLQDMDFQEGAIGNNNPFTDVSLSPLYSTTRERSMLAGEESFGELPVDRVSTVEKSTEQMAADAANTIFTLRKRRFDLVTGEAGEGAFGAGLSDGLKELDRIENNYLSLFTGKRYTQRIVRTFSVAPQPDGGVLICRFSETAGIVPDSDLSGSAVMLQFTSGIATEEPEPAPAASSRGRGNAAPAVVQRGPSMQTVRLIGSGRELDKQVIPVY